ncbi:MAG TPA: site-2 protease family protein [Bacteroidia bacterium]|jgi:Zn-dependent protease
MLDQDEQIKPNTDNGFPEKPIETIEKKSQGSSLISMGLFIAVFYFVLDWEIISILILTVVLLIHELGHYLAMRQFKYTDLGIFFVPLVGAFASGSKENASQKQQVIVLLAGPLPGIVIGLVLYYFGLKYDNAIVLKACNIFIVLNLFNLLPVMPLDGGRLVKSMFFENNQIISKIFLIISIAALTLYAFGTASYFLLIIPFFLIMQLQAQSQLKKVKEAIAEKELDLNKTFDELDNREYWLIRDAIGSHMKYYARYITPSNHVQNDNENKIIKEMKNILQKKPVADLGVGGKVLVTSLWAASFILPVIIIVIYFMVLGIEP